MILVQREVGERLVAGPGDEHYGPVSVRVAYRATRRADTPRAAVRVLAPAEGRVGRRSAGAVGGRRRSRSDAERLWRVVDAGFAERRKTMRSAVVRLGVDPGRADDLLREQGIDPRARAEQLSLPEFARIAEALP